jgi:hypothetical protein
MFTDTYRLVRLGMAEAQRAAEQERAHRGRDRDDEPYVVAAIDPIAPAPRVSAPTTAQTPLQGAARTTAVECGPCEASHQAA